MGVIMFMSVSTLNVAICPSFKANLWLSTFLDNLNANLVFISLVSASYMAKFTRVF